jgi:hypothetical protein
VDNAWEQRKLEATLSEMLDAKRVEGFHFILRVAALLSFLGDLRQRFDTISHPTASVASSLRVAA